MSLRSTTIHTLGIQNAGNAKEPIKGLGTECQFKKPQSELLTISFLLVSAKKYKKAENQAQKANKSVVQKQEVFFKGSQPLFTKVKNTVEVLRIPENQKLEVRSIQKRKQSQRSNTNQVMHRNSKNGKMEQILSHF